MARLSAEWNVLQPFFPEEPGEYWMADDQTIDKPFTVSVWRDEDGNLTHDLDGDTYGVTYWAGPIPPPVWP